MAFKATRNKAGLFEIHGLESYLEQKLAALGRALGLKTATPSKKTKAPTAARKPAAPKKPASKKSPVASNADPLVTLMRAFEAHTKKAALLKAGKQKDQLLRSLIPLYVSKGTFEVTSGTTTRFWAKHGVTFAAPNAAKALREHVGYARRTSKGPQITPNGIKYVEQAMAAKKAA